MSQLKIVLTNRNIKFDHIECHIRYSEVSLIQGLHVLTLRHFRCLPHIVNLAIKVVLSAITDMKYAMAGTAEYAPNGSMPNRTTRFFANVGCDPIATIQTLIQKVCHDNWILQMPLTNMSFQIWSLSLHKQYFSDVLKILQQKDLQLLWDMDIHWSSTILMIEWAIILHSASDILCSHGQPSLLFEFRPFRLFFHLMKWKSFENTSLVSVSGMHSLLSRKFSRYKALTHFFNAWAQMLINSL